VLNISEGLMVCNQFPLTQEHALSVLALKALILNNNEISNIKGLSSLSNLNSLGEFAQ